MFNGNYILKGKIVCQTGLHIGGSNNSIEIGGSDNVIIRDPINNLPYIPGSSLKGKIRNLLELNDDEIYKNVKQNNGEPSTQGIVADVFGKASDKSDYNINTENLTQESEDKLIEMIKDLQQQINELKNNNDENTEENNSNEKNNDISDAFAKLIVRDAYPTQETIEKWNDNYEIVNGSELKYENTIDRIYCTSNPRNIERVPVGSEFEFEMVYGIYDDNDNEDYAKEVYQLLNKGLKLLEDNYLGGSGTRGFGRVKIDDLTITRRSRNYYESNEDEIDITTDFNKEDNN